MRIPGDNLRLVARLNISVPDDLYELAGQWRGSINLSKICSRALQEELSAAEEHRSLGPLLEQLGGRSKLEQQLVDRFRLQEALVVSTNPETARVRETLGRATAHYLAANLSDGALLGFAGGRQTWCVARNLPARRLALTVTAVGFHHNDPRILHAHANTITTIAWLLFAPRANALLVGAPTFRKLWRPAPSEATYPRYFLVASCSEFDPASSFAKLLGVAGSKTLAQEGVFGDFAYAFFDHRGRIVELPQPESQSVIGAVQLQRLSARNDARVMLVAAGLPKRQVMRLALGLKLCNVLVTDEATAEFLLDTREGE